MYLSQKSVFWRFIYLNSAFTSIFQRCFMNSKIKTAYSVSLIVSLVMALFGIAMRSVLLFSQFEEAIGHYFASSYIDDAYYILLAVSALFLIIPAIIIRKSENLRAGYSDLPTLFSASFLSLCLFLFGIFILIDASVLGKSGLSLFFSVLSSFFAFCSVPYYILRICNINIKEDFFTLLSFAPVLFSCSLAFCFYFDSSMYMSSPLLILNQVSAILIAFFCLSESRVQLNRAKWGLYIAIALIAFIVTASNSLPAILFIPVSESATYGKIISVFTVFAFSLFIISRAFSIYSLNSKNATSLISFFRKASETEKTEEDDGEQIAIDLDSPEALSEKE